MPLSPQAENIFAQIKDESTKLGDLRKIAKEIKKNHELALELWSTGNLMARQLAILIMDKKQIDIHHLFLTTLRAAESLLACPAEWSLPQTHQKSFCYWQED